MTRMKTAILALPAAGLGLAALPSSAQAATVSRSCLVDHVAVMENRLHIKCLPNPGEAVTKDIRYFAMPLNEAMGRADKILSLAIGAKQAGRRMIIWFDIDDYASVPGCQGNDCRRLKAAAME